MYALSQIILWILWTLRPAMAVEANLIDIIQEAFAIFDDDETLYVMSEDPAHAALVAAELADAHVKLDLLIYLRACEIAGQRSRAQSFRPNLSVHGSRHTPDTCWRTFRNLVHRFNDYERLAHLRAKRMRREAEQYPLRLDAPHQSTSPAFAVEANHGCLLAVQIASLSAQHWGRWIGASSRRDGGGPATARGPPPSPQTQKQKAHTSQPPARTHPHAPIPQARPVHSVSIALTTEPQRIAPRTPS